MSGLVFTTLRGGREYIRIEPLAHDHAEQVT